MMDGADPAELQAELANVVSQTAPDAQYAHYHAKALELALQVAEQQKAGCADLLTTCSVVSHNA